MIMKGLIVIMSSTWKFAATFPVAVYLFKMSFVETILYTNIGGLLGIVIFTFLSKGIIHLIEVIRSKNHGSRKKPKYIFTKRNRRLVTLRKKYGLPGIVFLTPLILSIPVGCFLIEKYYGKNKRNFVFLVLSNVVWSFFYTAIYMKVQIAV